jgi:hypothetical protein
LDIIYFSVAISLFAAAVIIISCYYHVKTNEYGIPTDRSTDRADMEALAEKALYPARSPTIQDSK